MVVSLNNEHHITKKAHLCPKCKTEFDTRVHRGFLVKNFLFFLPIRRYECYSCKKKYYVWH